MGLRYDEVADIIKIIDGSSCDELIVETGDMKLVVRRNGAGAAEPRPVRQGTFPQRGPASLPSPEDAAEAARVKQSIPAPARPGRGDAAGQTEVVAPMVGTFYRAPSPEAPPFVEIGTMVKKGQALCLIEVMKLFTTVYADQAGRVVHIGAENGELVEYGRALFVLEPS